SCGDLTGRRPSLGTDKNPMVLLRQIQSVDSLARPIKAGFQLDHGDRKDLFVDLNCTEKAVMGELVQQKVDNLGNARHGAPQVKAGRLVKRIAPGWCDECDEQLP